MKILVLHGGHSVAGGEKPTYLADHGHEIINPALDHHDFDGAVHTAQAGFNQRRPDVIVGSSRGGAVAMNIESGNTPLVLLCPAWNNWGTARTLKPNSTILHSRADDVVSFADSEELVRISGLPPGRQRSSVGRSGAAGGNARGMRTKENVTMPTPIKVELVPYSPDWQELARSEALRLVQALGNIVVVHHIGSTALPGIQAKAIVDLLPVVRSLGELDGQKTVFAQLGYEFWGEYGIPGRRYCTFDDPSTGRRKYQLHCFARGSAEIAKHLAFRDYLRSNPVKAKEYEQEKRRCRELHPDDSHAYSDAKAGWIAAELPAALAQFARHVE